MTSDDFDTWRVVYSQFVGADSKYGISFALNNVPEAQNSCKVTKNNGRNELRKRPTAGVTLRDLDSGATVYGFSISLNTINAACNAKTHSRKQGCAKIPKRSWIQDPQDPRSGILMDIGSSISGFVVGSWGSWLLHAHFVERSWWILDPAFYFAEGSWGSWILYFYFSRGSWLSWILMLCFSMGSRGSWITIFWHCMRSWISTFGWSTSSSADAQVCTMSHICALSCIYWTCVSSAFSNIQELINNNHHHEQYNIFMD